MKYEYEPFQLKAWLRDEREKLKKATIKDVNKEYKGALVKLKEEFEMKKLSTDADFVRWANSLKRREKLLLPNLYDKDLRPSLKQTLIQIIEENAKEERRLFRVMADVVYQTCDLDDMWKLLKHSYTLHEERIEKRMEANDAKKWRGYLLSEDPIRFLAKTAYESDKSFLEELETFYLTENFPLFKYVLLDVLGFANEQFFLEEKELYKKYFAASTNEEQQEMTEKLIRQCQLNNVKDLGKFIYEKLKTYRRKPMLWKNVGEEEKRRFQQWILRLELKDFFSQVNQSHERFMYWKKYIHKLEDVVVTDERKTLIMYFSDIVIMEVLGTGAVYAYSVNTFQRHFQAKIDRMIQEQEKYEFNPRMKPREVKRSELMEKSYIYKDGWLTHRLGWQSTFDNWLRSRLNWEVDERVLQEEAKRIEADVNG
ncbi:hypothetical protein [Bacillus sp. CGMCC 1.16541]|uniref:hypothetical protein n=1 Tax=Bacillus sp. CGMCC 1.16541 TaxID=2185143 RepID=UPI000D72BF7B|nr:hypothetical protein [Bacillus sp. CGMCC 1.16541]